MKKLFAFFILALFIQSISYAQIPNGYYDPAAGLTGNALKTSLYNIIKGHTEYPYTSTSTDVWDILKETDRDPNNPNNVILIYTGWSVDAAQEYNNGAGWTREHVWAKSRGDFGTDLGPGTDCHHLRPCDVSVNSARNNRWFAECNEMYYDNGIPTGSYTSSTEWVWKPRDEVKGDIARMIFYMATRYEGENGEPDLEVIDYIPADQYTLEPIHAKLSDLLLWNQQDPVDDFERNRNEVVYGYQHNRNPFIDHPEYVEAIWGSGTLPTVPTAPTNLAISATDTQLDLTWSDVSSETGYYVYRSIDNVNFSTIATLNANSTFYSDINVSSGTIYYYYVKAFNAEGTSPASSTVNGQLNITGGSYASDLFFSEYVEGSSYNKALEVSNFTEFDLDLSHYVIKKQTNGAGDWSGGLTLSGTLAYGESFVIANPSATQTVLDKANLITGVGEMTFNGNDALSLWKDGVLIDMLGTFNDATYYAQDVTKIRNSDIASPNNSYTLSEWTNYSTDYFDNLGIHTFDGSAPTEDTQAPSAPANLVAGNITTSDLDLSWTASTDNVGVTAYDVYKNGVFLATTSTTNYSVSGLSASTTYSFYVKAKDAAGNISTASSTINATTNDPADTQAPTAPTNLTASNITTSSLDLTWTASTDNVGVTAYDVYKNGVFLTSTSTTNYSVSGLTSSTSYNFYVKAKDAAGNISANSNTEYVTTLSETITYCTSYGNDASEEWIARVQLATIDNTSSNSYGGYSDFTSINTNLTAGANYTITITPVWSGRSYKETEAVWIDFNQDGDFIDDGELVVSLSKSTASPVSASFTVPTTALSGSTRMRVSMKYNASPTSCEIFKYGEVEDYTVNILGGKGIIATNNQIILNENDSQILSYNIYPNPAKDKLFIDNADNSDVYIYSLNGKLILHQKLISNSIDVSLLEGGMYLIKINNDDQIYNYKFIKQ